jgi:DNA polymerase III psi subunit
MTEDQASQAQMRDHYLQTLGIVQYASRDLCDAEVVDRPVTAVQEQSVAYTSQPQSVIEEIVVDLKSSTSSAKQRQLPQSTGVASSQADDLELTFALWQPNDELLIATAVEDELPDSQQTKLLSHILLAMDKNLPSLPQFEAIKWPPHSHIKGSEQEAKEFLSTLIDTRMLAVPVKTLLLLGESTAQWLLPSQQDVNVDKAVYPLSDRATALVVPSLPEMLANPQCKRVAWGTICRYLCSRSI